MTSLSFDITRGNELYKDIQMIYLHDIPTYINEKQNFLSKELKIKGFNFCQVDAYHMLNEFLYVWLTASVPFFIVSMGESLMQS